MKYLKLQNRLIDFSVQCIELRKCLGSSYATDYLSKQLIRSSCSSALNYGEAISAESKRDFIHKMAIVLKELRESQSALLILAKVSDSDYIPQIKDISCESNELIAIFVVSIKTAQRGL